METAFIVMGCVLFSICLIIAIVSIKNLISARKKIKESKSKEMKMHFVEVQRNIELKNKYQILDSLRKELINSNIESAIKYNQEHGLDFHRKESIIIEKLTESVNEIFNSITNDEDFDNITLEDFENCNKDLLFGAFNLYLDAISVKAFAITLYFSLDLEVMQPTCNYEKNIDIIMDFISESIKNPEFDNFTTEDTKNYLKNKFNQL